MLDRICPPHFAIRANRGRHRTLSAAINPSTLNAPKLLLPIYGRGTGVDLGLGVTCGLAVGVGLGVAVGVELGVTVGVGVDVGVPVAVGVGVGVPDAVGVGVGEGGVVVGVGVGDGGVPVAVGVGVGVGCGAPPTLRRITIALCSPLGGNPIAAATSIRPSPSKSATVPSCGVFPMP